MLIGISCFANLGFHDNNRVRDVTSLIAYFSRCIHFLSISNEAFSGCLDVPACLLSIDFLPTKKSSGHWLSFLLVPKLYSCYYSCSVVVAVFYQLLAQFCYADGVSQFFPPFFWGQFFWPIFYWLSMLPIFFYAAYFAWLPILPIFYLHGILFTGQAAGVSKGGLGEVADVARFEAVVAVAVAVGGSNRLRNQQMSWTRSWRRIMLKQ